MKVLHPLPVLGMLLAAAGCKNVSPAAQLGVGSRTLDGAIGIDDANVRAKNSVEALGLDDAATTVDARVDLTFETAARMHLALKGFQSSHDGSGRLDEDFAKGPILIPAGTSVDSDFDLGLYSAAWTFDLAERDELEAGIGFGVAWVDLEASFRSNATGDEIFTDESVPIPLLAGRLAWSAERLAFGLEASGIDIGYAGDHATFVDVDLSARWRFLGKRFGRNGELLLGWRHAYAGVDYDDDLEAVDASVSLSGPYFGLGFRF
ncbi:MAG: hypothetical protein IT453_10410 [Planctomycetes bacterium]|nr:hypothetical protein [Planctomycetota bacterium]